MKKVLSIVLVLSMLFAFVTVIAGATNGEYQTYCITYDIQDAGIHIQPIEGYYTYVEQGQSFKFTLEVDRDEEGEPLYSDKLTIVQANGISIEPNIYGIYEINNIEEDTTITVFLTQDTQSTNFIMNLLTMIRSFLKVFYDTLTEFFRSIRT